MSSIEQLFAEVYANPDDDQVRRVLADALLATGDPRGELILFQLEPDKDYHRRALNSCTFLKLIKHIKGYLNFIIDRIIINHNGQLGFTGNCFIIHHCFTMI